MQEKWEDWILVEDIIVNRSAKEPSCKVVAEWHIEAYRNI
jgi:hypothetical protein